MKWLLAKSSPSPDNPTAPQRLQGHTSLVLRAAEILLEQRLACTLEATRLPAAFADRLRRIVLVGALLHDLGKASEDFQRMIRGTLGRHQAMRHEAISLWLCWRGQPLWDWIRRGFVSDTDALLAVLAAAGHHRKFTSMAFAPDAPGTASLVVHTDHDGFHATLRLGEACIELGAPPILAKTEISLLARRHPRCVFKDWEAETSDLLSRPHETTLLAVAKAFVLDADVAGSAFRSSDDLEWIRDALAHRATARELHAIVDRQLRGAPLRPFQQAVRDCEAPLQLVKAGCGSGKTVAAYAWAAAQHPGKQLWFTYPTTGTTTEGYRGYVHSSGLRGRLEHSRRLVDLDLLETEGDERGLDGSEEVGADTESVYRKRDRLDALRVWEAKVVTATVDTVLGLIQNQRKGTYAWASLVDAVVVFDEIHSYDDRLFGALLRFLGALPGIPSLLMTASLPKNRFQALEELCHRVHGAPIAITPGPDDFEMLPRYRSPAGSFDAPSSREEAILLARETVRRGKKVLWVSNTVNRARRVFEELAELQPALYHSRYRYTDRVRRHDAVMKAFSCEGPAIVCATQVAEMSLDISADLMITDLAPIPALIQRLGRLNRAAGPDRPGEPRPFMVIKPDTAAPYEPDELERAQNWLRNLPGEVLSQRDLSDAWCQLSLTGEPAFCPQPSTWLDGGFRTEAAPLRIGSHTVEVLLPEDIRGVAEGQLLAVEVALPMPFPPRRLGSIRDWGRLGCWPVPPVGAIEYDAKRGGEWHKP